jgi:hypothetical protein
MNSNNNPKQVSRIKVCRRFTGDKAANDALLDIIAEDIKAKAQNHTLEIKRATK